MLIFITTRTRIKKMHDYSEESNNTNVLPTKIGRLSLRHILLVLTAT